MSVWPGITPERCQIWPQTKTQKILLEHILLFHLQVRKLAQKLAQYPFESPYGPVYLFPNTKHSVYFSVPPAAKPYQRFRF